MSNFKFELSCGSNNSFNGDLVSVTDVTKLINLFCKVDGVKITVKPDKNKIAIVFKKTYTEDVVKRVKEIPFTPDLNVYSYELSKMRYITYGYYANEKLLNICKNLPYEYMRRVAYDSKAHCCLDPDLIEKREYDGDDDGLIKTTYVKESYYSGEYCFSLNLTLENLASNLTQLESFVAIISE